MPRMPTFEEIRADFEREAAAAGRLFRHHHETSAAPAAATATHQENTMKMSAIAEDLKNAAAGADSWIHAVLGQHLPALVAEVERFQGNPIVQELEALGETMLPPGDVAIITGIIRMAGRAAGQAAPQQADTAQQADVPQVPSWQPADGQQGEPSSDPRNR